MVSVLVSTYSPHSKTLSFNLDPSTPISSLSNLLTAYCPLSHQSLSSPSTRILDPSSPISSLQHDQPFITLRLGVKMLGGKGGFASQLRAQGGRMSSNKATNNDSCRDLNGRRLSTIKEATKLAAYIQAAPDRAAVQKKEAQAKLEALQKEIAQLDSGLANSGGNKKRRLEDGKFVEESRELNEGVRDAVKEAMMKKRRKNKAAAGTAVEGNAAASTSGITKALPVKSSGAESGSDKEQVGREKENKSAEGDKTEATVEVK